MNDLDITVRESLYTLHSCELALVDARAPKLRQHRCAEGRVVSYHALALFANVGGNQMAQALCDALHNPRSWIVPVYMCMYMLHLWGYKYSR